MDQNNEDKPLSSEEMLRRARGGLGETTPTPPDTREAPPGSPGYDYQPSHTPEFEVAPAPDPTRDTLSAPDVSYESSPTMDYEKPSLDYEPPGAETAMPEPAEESVGGWTAPPMSPVEDDNVASWAPPMAGSESGTAPSAPPTYVPEQKRSSRINLGRIFAIVIGVVILVSFLTNMFDRTKTVDDIAVGHCMDVPEDTEFSTFDPIDCAQPHDLEVFAVIDMSTVSSEFSVGATYPGDDTLYYAAIDECIAQPFESYVGAPYDSIEYSDAVLWVDAFTPTLAGWNDYDDREVQCVLLELDASTGDIIKSTGSYKGSRS